jgi:Fe-S-cluster containining protein
LADVVPWARAVCAKVTGVAVDETRRGGGHVPCQKGCSACCCYLVPLSVPEAFRLRQEVYAMPASRRRRVQKACLSVATRIPESPIPELPLEQSTCTQDQLNTVSDWYADLHLICPFLERDECTIYEKRPLSCREHFVEGCAEACRTNTDDAQKVDIPVRMSEVLGRLAAEIEGADMDALILPLALIWADENQHRDRRMWPTELLAERFAGLVQETILNADMVVS